MRRAGRCCKFINIGCIRDSPNLNEIEKIAQRAIIAPLVCLIVIAVRLPRRSPGCVEGPAISRVFVGIARKRGRFLPGRPVSSTMLHFREINVYPTGVIHNFNAMGSAVINKETTLNRSGLWLNLAVISGTWGGSFLFVKLITPEVPPFAFAPSAVLLPPWHCSHGWRCAVHRRA